MSTPQLIPFPSVSAIGLDVGGANLKAAVVRVDFEEETLAREVSTPWATSMPFPLWRHPDRLMSAIEQLLAACPPEYAGAPWGVTMTGELADCFPDKATGVRAIVDAVSAAAGTRQVRFWSTQCQWMNDVAAKSDPVSVAASNWHGLACCLGSTFDQEGVRDAFGEYVGWTSALLVDVGSTTTDLIPFNRAGVLTNARTDLDRLCSGQLVYTGVRRTPLAAVSSEVPLRIGVVPVASELFATTLDVGLMTGMIPENATDCETADGRPATREFASDRIARMLCCDRTELSPDEIRSLAEHWLVAQKRQIVRALERQRKNGLAWPEVVVVSGEGAWLARQVVGDWYAAAGQRGLPTTISLAELISPEAASAACAWAMGRLILDRPEDKGWKM